MAKSKSSKKREIYQKLERKSRVLIMLGVVILCFFYVAYFVLPKTSTPQDQVKTPKQEEKTTPPQLEEEKQPIDHSAEVQQIYSSTVDYWQDWNWEDKMIEGRIRDIDNENDELTILVTRPKNQEFSESLHRMLIKCEPESTYKFAWDKPTGDYLDSGFNLLGEADLGDIFHGYCMEEECLNITKACFLTVFDY